jgi:hypothetical protein
MYISQDLIETPTCTMATATESASVVSPPTDLSTSLTTSSMINLTMRVEANLDFYTDRDVEDCDRVQVMLMQESTTYKVGSTKIIGTSTERSSICRSIMVDWSFHLVDHFHLDREIVEVAFSYLDRFVEKCSTDDAAFKLACMTCLYIASKNIGPKYIPLKSLSELSGGEFNIQNFVDMEICILKSLDWRVQPPTTRVFIGLFLTFLPSNKVSMKQALSRRAFFYSELSLFDYNCALDRKSLIALSSILNAIEDIYPTNMADVIAHKFKGELMFALKLANNNADIMATRRRLSRLYTDSEQYMYEVNQLHLLSRAAEKSPSMRGRTFSKDSISSEPNGSPVSVYVL